MADIECNRSLTRALRDCARRLRCSLARWLLRLILPAAGIPPELHAGCAAALCSPSFSDSSSSAAATPFPPVLETRGAGGTHNPRGQCSGSYRGGAAHDRVSAMVTILAALEGGERVSFEEVRLMTGLEPARLRGHAMNLREDGYLIFERQETLRLTHTGEAALEEFYGSRGDGLR